MVMAMDEVVSPTAYLANLLRGSEVLLEAGAQVALPAERVNFVEFLGGKESKIEFETFVASAFAPYEVVASGVVEVVGGAERLQAPLGGVLLVDADKEPAVGPGALGRGRLHHDGLDR